MKLGRVLAALVLAVGGSTVAMAQEGPVQDGTTSPAPVPADVPGEGQFVDSQGRIVNGEKVDPGGAPWMVQLFTTYAYTCRDLQNSARAGGRNADFAGRAHATNAGQCLTGARAANSVLDHLDSWQLTHYCGGAYIGEGWIITAAHCFLWSGEFPNAEQQAKQLERWRYRLGTQDISSEGLVLPIERIVLHKGYKATRQTASVNDIALVKLKNAGVIKSAKSVRGVKLAWPGADSDPRMTVTGWGSMTFHASNKPVTGVDNLPRMLMKTSLELSNQCGDRSPNPKVREYYSRYKPDRPSTICATGVSTNGKGTGDCYGDSGGPVTMAHEQGTPTLEKVRNPPKYILVGLVSRGPACGEKGTPGVYTKVSSFKDWIASAMANSQPGFSEM